jgi:hypothetical protein
VSQTFGNGSNGTTPTPVPGPAECVRSGRATLLGGEALPHSVVAVSYALELALPDPNNATATRFTGTVTGTLRATQRTSCFMVHAVGLETLALTVTVDGRLAETEVVREEANMWSVVNLKGNATLEEGSVVVYVTKYAGSVGTARPDGLYRGRNAVGAHDAGLMLATHMQYLHAREVFPVLDEPAFKALWTATIAVPEVLARDGTSVLFNTPEDVPAQRVEGGLRYHAFEQTLIPLAPYLVALAVGDFDVVAVTQADGLVHEIVGPRGASAYLSYALDASRTIVAAYEGELGAAARGYTLRSMTKRIRHVASAFAGGAMENMGLIIYANSNLLVDPVSSTLAERQRVKVVMAHELAHMWFGDLVTTVSWRQLFNNEGMAEYMQYVAVDHTDPDWNLWTMTTGEGYLATRQRALRLDLAGSNSPVIVNATAKGDNNAITYVKGACINRQVHALVGTSTYREAMTDDYLSKYKLGNANVDQWIQAVADAVAASAAGGSELARAAPHVARDLLTKAGFPVVTITTTDGAGNITAAAAQAPVAAAGALAGTLWHVAVPLSIRTAAAGHREVAKLDLNFAGAAGAASRIYTRDPADGDHVFATVADAGSFYGLVRYDSLATWKAASSYYASPATAQSKRVTFFQSMVALVETSNDLIEVLSAGTAAATPTCVAPFDKVPPVGSVTKADALEVIRLLLEAWAPLARAVEGNATLVAEVAAGIETLVKPAADDLGFGVPVPNPSPSPTPSPNGSNGTNASLAASTASLRALSSRRLGSGSTDLSEVLRRDAATAVEREVAAARRASRRIAMGPAYRALRRAASLRRDDDDSATGRDAEAGVFAAAGRRLLSYAAAGGNNNNNNNNNNDIDSVLEEDAEDELARASVMFYAVYFAVADYQDQASRVFAGFHKEGKTVPQDVLEAVLWGAMRAGSEEDVQAVLATYKSLNGTAMAGYYAFALGGARADDCDAAIAAISNDIEDDRVALENLAGSLRLNPDCKAKAWARFKTIAPVFWGAEGRTVREIERTPFLSDSFIGAFATEEEYFALEAFLLAHTDKLPIEYVRSVLSRAALGVNVLRANSGDPPFVPPEVTPTPTPEPPAPSPEPEKGGGGSKVLYIVLGVAGGLALLGGVGYFAMRRPTHDRVPGFESPLVRDSRAQYSS